MAGDQAGASGPDIGSLRLAGEARVFALDDASTNFAAASNAAGLPILARPFFDPELNVQNACS